MRVKVAVLALCMLFTGTINTIATKYQDITVVGVDSAGKPRYFQHPAVQSACMFLGESLCLIPYFYLRWRRQKRKRLDPAYVPRPHHEKRSRRIQRIMAFAVPTLADACGTTLMNVGLFFTYASTYQMLRGTLVLFAGMFTVIILRRQLHSHHWFGMVLITAGAAIVGASSVIYPPPSSHNGSLGGVGPAAGVDAHAAEGLAALARHLLLHPQQQQQLLLLGDASILGSSGGLLSKVKEGAAAAAPLFGDVLVVLAQMFTALQFIMEEKYLVKYKVPTLLAVGLEGCWGLALSLLVLPVTTLVRGPDGQPLDDAVAALQQIFSIRALTVSVGTSVLSIAFFNFFGVSVTKSLSGAARATIDACRTLFIWLVSMHIGWEEFHVLEVVGFVVLLSGSSLYNEILKSCLPAGGGPSEAVSRSRPGSRRRSRTPGPSTGGAAAARGDEEAALTQPLLAGGAAGREGSHGPAGGLPVPVVVTRGTAHLTPDTRAALGYTPADGSGGDWMYTMARSMRLGAHALSPKSLASGAFGAFEQYNSSVSDASYLGGEGGLGASYSTPNAHMLGRDASYGSLPSAAGGEGLESAAETGASGSGFGRVRRSSSFSGRDGGSGRVSDASGGLPGGGGGWEGLEGAAEGPAASGGGGAGRVSFTSSSGGNPGGRGPAGPSSSSSRGGILRGPSPRRGPRGSNNNGGGSGGAAPTGGDGFGQTQPAGRRGR